MSDPILVPVHKTRRLTLLGFRRAATGDPDPAKPDLDDRGFGASEYGPVVGVRQGDTITVHLVRERIDKDAALFVTSSNPAVASIPGAAALPKKTIMDLKIQGVAGQSPSVALIQVRFGSAGGPILAQLGAWVYQPLTVRIAPHVMNIASTAGGAAVGPSNVPADLIARANDTWRPVGIQFAAIPTLSHNHAAALAGTISWAELPAMFATYHQANAINVFFVHHCNDALGWGVARNVIATYGFTQPGIAVADEGLTGFALDAQLKGQLLAHELGHFLGLWHPEKVNATPNPPGPRKDAYSRRMLMYPTLPIEALGDWRDDLGYGKFQTWPRGGALITMKNLSQQQTDGEAATARGVAVNPY